MNETNGNRISKYRKEKGMTQEELAGKLGVSSQAVSKWENDASCPDISLLPELCRILGNREEARKLYQAGRAKWPDDLDFASGEARLGRKGKR